MFGPLEDEEYAQEVEREAQMRELAVRTLPTEDGTYQFDGTIWHKADETSGGFYVAQTDGDYDPVRFQMDPWQLVGVWTDPETGKRDVDEVVWFEDRDEAIQYGRDCEQKAIWDIANGTEIFL